MIDFRNFKKVNEDEKTVTLRHEKGHEVRIVKNALDKKTRHVLSAIPSKDKDPENEKLAVANKYAEGGDVEKTSSQSSDAPTMTPDAPQSSSPVTINIGSGAQGASGSPPIGAAPTESAPTSTTIPDAPPSSPPSPTAPTIPTTSSPSDAAFAADPKEAALSQLPSAAQGVAALKQGAKAVLNDKIPVTDAALAGKEPTLADITAATEADKAPAPQASAGPTNYEPKAPASLAPQGIEPAPSTAPGLHPVPKDDGQKAMAQATDDFQRRRQRWEDEHRELFNDLKNSKVDYDHLASRGTMAKILSTVGLVLGGFTGVFAPAMIAKHIQKDIDRDIENQRADIGQKRTLLEEHMKEFGNIKDAADAVRMNLATAAQSQLAKSTSFKNNADAQKTYMELDQYRQNLANQLSIRQAIKHAPDSPDVRAQAVKFLVPEKHQEQAMKELDRVENAATAEKNIRTLFAQAAKDNTIAGRVAHAGFSPASVDALRTNLMPVLKDNEGRINEQEIQMLNALTPAPGDTDTKQRMKLDGLIKFVRSKQSSALLTAYGVPKPRPIPSITALPKPAGWR